ncbi:MAG TPA: integration host factor [Actinobacteria bacterium]|nr:integration host factor [Actinomycetota bacterium]
MSLPPLTDEQRAAAGARATAARRIRAEVRANLKSGDIRISEVIDRAAVDEAIAKLKVVALLEALPGVGKAKAATIMERHHIAPSRRVRGLGQHQREALTGEFG